jgi:hypothetical protein
MNVLSLWSLFLCTVILFHLINIIILTSKLLGELSGSREALYECNTQMYAICDEMGSMMFNSCLDHETAPVLNECEIFHVLLQLSKIGQRIINFISSSLIFYHYFHTPRHKTVLK